MKVILCAFALLFPALCFSQPYAGVSVGFGLIDDTFEDEDEFYDVDETSPAFRAFFGHKWKKEGVGLAMEFAYLYSDDMDIRAEVPFDVSGLEDEFDIKAVGGDFIISYEIGRMSPFVSIGYYHWDASVDVNTSLRDTDVGLSFEGDDVSYGAGMDLRISKHLGARLEWKRLEMEIGEWDVDL